MLLSYYSFTISHYHFNIYQYYSKFISICCFSKEILNSILKFAYAELHYPLFTLLFYLLFRALAASAPIWQFQDMVPCGVFLSIVTRDYKKSGPNCSESIRMSWKAINRLGSTSKF